MKKETRKRIGKSILLLACVCMLGFGVKIHVNATETEDYDVLEENNGVSIIAYNGTDTEVEIPAKVNDKVVVSIAQNAFEGKEITKVTIPATVKTIASNSFLNCSKLGFISFEGPATQVEVNAFKGIVAKAKVTCYYGTSAYQYFKKVNAVVHLKGFYVKGTSVTTYVGQTVKVPYVNAVGAVRYATSNASVATVAANGVITARNAGTAVLTAVNSGVTCKYTVVVKGLKMNQTAATITAGFSTRLGLGANVPISWKSSNTKVATVNGAGVVYAKKSGSATITGRAYGRNYSCKVVVKKNSNKFKKKYSKSIYAQRAGTATIGFGSIEKSGNTYKIKGHIFNTMLTKVLKIKKITVKVYADGKLIGKKTFKNLKTPMKSYSKRSFTWKMNCQNIDLRKAKLKATFSNGRVVFRKR